MRLHILLRPHPRLRLLVVSLLAGLLAVGSNSGGTAEKKPRLVNAEKEYASEIRPLLQKYCLGCHSTKKKKGSLDLERFGTVAAIRKEPKPWQGMIEQLEAGEMPPRGRPQPTAAEKRKLLLWVKGFLDAEARANKGDPGRVPLRRLSNFEYDCTIRDLTGVDLRPTREFPADGAGGEGFTNAAEALSDISPALLNKYLKAAKGIADHAMLLPDGFRFSRGATRRDWTDESTARIRAFYAEFTRDGKLNFVPYLAASIKHREALGSGKRTLAEVAAKEHLNPRYLKALWDALTGAPRSFPMDDIRARWRKAGAKDVPALAAEITQWQAALWRFQQIGSYRYGQLQRQVANDPHPASQTLKLTVKPEPGQRDVLLYLQARGLLGGDGRVVWERPRFEAPGLPTLLLKDYPKFGPQFEVDYAVLFSQTANYLAAAAEAAKSKAHASEIAKKHRLDETFLNRWIEVLALKQAGAVLEAGLTRPLRTIPAGALTLLEARLPKDPNQPAINGWHKKGTDLPVAVSNSSDKIEKIPGTVRPHGIAVHPMPKEYVAAAWASPIEGKVKIIATITHAHPACGNGVAYRIEHRHGKAAAVLAEGPVAFGKHVQAPPIMARVEKGDTMLLVVDARDGSHVCDMTGIALSFTEIEKPGRKWDLANDVAGSILDGNPHADSHGNKAVWSFVRGASIPGGSPTSGPLIPPDSVLAKWKAMALIPGKKGDAAPLAAKVQELLTGPRPAKENPADRLLFDHLASPDSPLIQGLNWRLLGKPRSTSYGLPGKQFTGDDLASPGNTPIVIRLPAALLHNRSFLVEAKSTGGAEQATQVQVSTSPIAQWGAKNPIIAPPGEDAAQKLLSGYAQFREVFPSYLCYQRVIPTDEVVSLKMFHREDEPLQRLFLKPEQTRRINRLWAEHRFISLQAIKENDYLPQFIGFVTQDQPTKLLRYFESQRPTFKKRAEELERDLENAIPRQLAALWEFADRAYRRPLADAQKSKLQALYREIRQKGATHEEAFRDVLARILVSPAFLFRIEQSAPGNKPGAVSDWELATRLSYFLWSSIPDGELRSLAQAGKLRDPRVMADQVRRMLKDPKARSLAIEFGTQWLHVRGFDELKEKNERLYPTFDSDLRKAMYEETILFFQDLFASDRPVASILDADYTFLNERLARHYGIIGIKGPSFRRVGGVKKHGRGGILGLASVQTRQSGASRTSPVLRGNWVVETLLGEKLPKPPPDVPKLPEEEGAGNLSTRQLVEKHVSAPSCAVCHIRIDPFGFALEHYDAIGRFREKDRLGLAIDARSKLKDGTTFEGIDGLRDYLLKNKKEIVVRLFCKKLLGYALGRSATLFDTALTEEMASELSKEGRGVVAAVQALVRSPQFRMIRGIEQE